MSDYIDTREGWRELGPGEAARGDWVQRYDKAANSYRTWVRVSPVPPLPTEPYTVIRVTWADDHDATADLVLWPTGLWLDDAGDTRDLASISAWEPLAEPRAVTAKAALAEARAYVFQALAEDVNFEHIAQGFGVSS